jgi:hypothetical protein
VVVNKPIKVLPGELRCPRCFGKDIVPSMPRGLLDVLMGILGKIPRHCRFCENRFYVYPGELPQDGVNLPLPEGNPEAPAATPPTPRR